MHKPFNEKIEGSLFYLMLIFSCLAYLGFYLYAKENGIRLIISYSRSSSAMMSYSSPLVLLFRFGKDICAVLLLLVELLSSNKTAKAWIFLIMIAVISYGTIVTLLCNAGSVAYTLASGYRPIIYFGALSMLFAVKRDKNLPLKRLFIIITVLLVLNTVIAAIQAFDFLGTNYILIGKRSYRFMGLFPAAAAFAYYCFGSALFACIVETYTKEFHRYTVLIIIVSLLGCYLSGTRSAMINLLVVIYFYIIDQSRMRAGQKIIISLILAVPALFFFLRFSLSMADRGSILENAITGGRFTVFADATIHQPIAKIIFGNGIGAGSNSMAGFATLNQAVDVYVLDGTFTSILYQFGMLGLFFIFYIFWYVVNRIIRTKGLLYAALFVFTIILMGLTCNVLEAFALLIMLFLSFFTLIEGNKIFYELSPQYDRSRST